VRFMIMHRTNAHWEAGAVPDDQLLARVGSLLVIVTAASLDEPNRWAGEYVRAVDAKEVEMRELE
jgi:hypothetical protein